MADERSLDDILAVLDADAANAVVSAIDEMKRQRDQARNESIEHRRGLKSSNAEMSAQLETLKERFGVESVDDIPDPKEHENETQKTIKKMQRELAKRDDEAKALKEKQAAMTRAAAIRDAMSKYDWADSEVAETYISARVTSDGDDLLIKDGDAYASLREGLEALKTIKPSLFKAPRPRGSGYNERDPAPSKEPDDDNPFRHFREKNAERRKWIAEHS